MRAPLIWTGRVIDVLNFQPQEGDILIIAERLSRIERYAGGGSQPYYVAEHCCHVHDLLLAWGRPASLCLAGLLHDAHEAVTGDVAGPCAQLLLSAWPTLCGLIQNKIDEAYDVYTQHCAVETADYAVRIPEWDHLFPGWRHYDGAESIEDREDLTCDHVQIQCWDSRNAKNNFLRRFVDVSRLIDSEVGEA
jgi:hypothetical protein